MSPLSELSESDPFARLPQVPAFTLTSDFADGQPFAPAQLSAATGVPGGQDASPRLSWSGAPEGTRGYAVTVFDADAPTMSGFFHWVVTGIPAEVTSLPAGAGAPGGEALPPKAVQMPNDARLPYYIGAAPPAGDGRHRYFVTVHALDVEQVEVPADGTPAYLIFASSPHVLARATLVATAETPAG